MKIFKRILISSLALVLSAGLLVGCGSKKEAKKSADGKITIEKLIFSSSKKKILKIMEVKVMNQEEKKELMGKYAKKLENAIKREVAVIKEIENDKALIKYLEGQKTSGAAFDNTVYESYDAWIETIKKQIKKSENTLKNIEFKKVELEAVQKYIA